MSIEPFVPSTAPSSSRPISILQSPQLRPFSSTSSHFPLATDQSVACLIGLPPPAMRALHRPAFVNRFWFRMLERVNNPIEVDTTLGVRRVQVLGQAVYEFGLDGCVTTSIWQFGIGGLHREAISEAHMTIERTPYRDRWIEYFQSAFVAEYAANSVFGIEEIRDYACWVFACLRNRLRRSCDVRKMRRIIALGLAFDPPLQMIARRIRLAVDDPRHLALASTYNHVVAHRDDYETLERETPNLIPLFAIFVGEEDFPSDGEATQRLRAYLRKHGFSPRLWRLLAHAKGRVLPSFLDFYTGTTVSATFDLLRVLDLIGCHRMPPPWFLWELLQLFGDPANRKRTYAEQVATYRSAVMRINTIMEHASDAELACMRDGLSDVLAWLIESGDFAEIPAATQRKASWQWYRRRAAGWQLQEEAKLRESRLRWSVPFKSRQLSGCEIVALSTGYDLWRESRMMRHCATKFVARCLAGKHLVCSVRKPGMTRPLCSVRFERTTNGWRFVQVSGFANRLPPPLAGRAVRKLADILADDEALLVWLRSDSHEAIAESCVGDLAAGPGPSLSVGVDEESDNCRVGAQ